VCRLRRSVRNPPRSADGRNTSGRNERSKSLPGETAQCSRHTPCAVCAALCAIRRGAQTAHGVCLLRWLRPMAALVGHWLCLCELRVGRLPRDDTGRAGGTIRENSKTSPHLCGEIHREEANRSKYLQRAARRLNVAGTLRVPSAPLCAQPAAERRRHTECACYVGCGRWPLWWATGSASLGGRLAYASG
jgi:hypothetical protein